MRRRRPHPPGRVRRVAARLGRHHLNRHPFENLKELLHYRLRQCILFRHYQRLLM